MGLNYKLAPLPLNVLEIFELLLVDLDLQVYDFICDSLAASSIRRRAAARRLNALRFISRFHRKMENIVCPKTNETDTKDPVTTGTMSIRHRYI